MLNDNFSGIAQAASRAKPPSRMQPLDVAIFDKVHRDRRDKFRDRFLSRLRSRFRIYCI